MIHAILRLLRTAADLLDIIYIVETNSRAERIRQIAAEIEAANNAPQSPAP